eukprot:SAG22_NODE_3670_length_1584_cov_1.645118_1_plen_70_part_10
MPLGGGSSSQAGGQGAYDVPRGSPPTSPPPAPRAADTYDGGAGVGGPETRGGPGPAGDAEDADNMELARL